MEKKEEVTKEINGQVRVKKRIKSYSKGYRKERSLVNQARGEGKIAYRSAGSHSDVDVTTIDPVNKIIELIQAKNKKYISPAEKKKYKAFLKLNGTYIIKARIE